jgi:6,7-dimethyl-8-ribityllumazine synthase
MNYIKAVKSDRKDGFPIALVVSLFNQSITEALQKGALEKLADYGFKETDITIVQVPGAVEIPLAVQLLAKQNRFSAIIALGAVIRGETTHYDYVCEQVSQGCQQVMLNFELPVIFGVLTTENEVQAWERLGGDHGHKGKDAVDCAVAMVSLVEQLEQL